MSGVPKVKGYNIIPQTPNPILIPTASSVCCLAFLSWLQGVLKEPFMELLNPIP